MLFVAKTHGERSCFIAANHTTYCFYRNIDHRLTVIVMNGTTTDTQDVDMNSALGRSNLMFMPMKTS